MTFLERLNAFLFRKRRWQWLAVGIALVAIGQYLEAQKVEAKSVAEQGQKLTLRLHDRLAALQPGAIADLYARAGRGRHGIGWCGPTAATEPLTLRPKPHLSRNPAAALAAEARRTFTLPPLATPLHDDAMGNVMAPLERRVDLPMPRSTAGRPPLSSDAFGDRALLPGQRNVDPLRALADRERLAPGQGAGAAGVAAALRAPLKSNCDRGWPAMFDAAALNLRTTPEIAWVVWKEGGWSATILLALTLAGMSTLIITVWNQKDIGCAAVPMTLFVLALGPVIAGGVFWLMLQLLLGMTVVLGHVLAGLALVLAWIAGLSKIVMIGFETLTKGDEAEENFESLKASLGMEKPPAD